ncbi:MAG: class I SAM-dependent methyltransferase [Hydrogenothermaceae bacterium]
MSKFDLAALTWDEKPMRVNIAKSVAEGVKKLIPLKKDFKILDFGCGTGLVSFFLAEDVGQIVGVDSSQGMVDVFNKKAQENNINAKAYKLDILNEDFEEGDFDLIVSSMTFHHIKEPVQMLNRLKNYLKNGGYIAIADLVKEDGTFHDYNEGVEHFGFDIDQMVNYLKEAGFTDIKSEIVYKVKKDRDGKEREYPIFLVIGKNS